MDDLQFDPDLVATLAALETHRVELVLVGDVARAIYDHGGFVSGVAIVPADYGRNAERLASALNAMTAELGLAGRPDARGRDWRRMDLRELAPCSFMTIYADVDLDFRPAGTNGYRDLFQDAARVELGRGARPHVASLDDLDRIARGAGRQPVAPPAALPRVAPLHASPPDALAPAAALYHAEPRQLVAPELDAWDEAEIRATIRDAMSRSPR